MATNNYVKGTRLIADGRGSFTAATTFSFFDDRKTGAWMEALLDVRERSEGGRISVYRKVTSETVIPIDEIGHSTELP